jgi:hypothetical protein
MLCSVAGECVVSGVAAGRVYRTPTKRLQMNKVRYAALLLNRGTLAFAHTAVAARAIEANNAIAELAYLWSQKISREKFVGRITAGRTSAETLMLHPTYLQRWHNHSFR